MSVGTKIKELRSQSNLTQKDLADQLHVTYQAISRWENDESEPSIDTLKEISKILNCTLNELFEVEDNKENNTITGEIVEANEPVEIVPVYQEPKIVLGICENCNTPIFDAENLNRIDESHMVRHGRTHHTVSRMVILCNKCNEERNERLRKQAEAEKKRKKLEMKKRRIHSYIWPGIIAAIFIAVGISSFATNDNESGTNCVLTGVTAYCFAATMILDNTFIPDMWEDIASWGFVKLPGIIFEFSIDGFLFLIAMKILFFFLGLILAILAVIFATILAMLLSVVVYPFALIRNIKGIE